MIHPQLATMLVYIFTDVAATPAELQALLRETCDQTFNCISIDGDTSTNDTVLLLASGRSGVQLEGTAAAERTFPPHYSRFASRWQNRSSAMAKESDT